MVSQTFTIKTFHPLFGHNLTMHYGRIGAQIKTQLSWQDPSTQRRQYHLLLFFFPVHKNFIKQNNIHWLWGMYVIPRFAHKLSSFQLPLPSLGFLSLKHKLQCPGNCPTFRCLWHTNSRLTCSLKSLQCRKGPVNATNIREITKILKFQRVFEGVFSGQGEVWIPIFLSVSPILLVYIDALSRYLPKEHGHWRDMNRDLNVGSITKSAMDAGK